MFALVIVLSLINLILWSDIFYRQFFKRFYDILLSGIAIIVLSPVLLVLTILGAIKMKGNPFFTQERPGKNEKIFLAHSNYLSPKYLDVGYLLVA